ncbi:hypothetical protein [Zooshikella harenae]|uniref:Succinate dehydrogenase, hydrophobic membrane anchor protein n=1 Tax=Zooshikella harenae TaxID=2827238 RepID=A0ABS5ZIY2_9GAMM|nr:hypothetical protein [Zooshikella harenae]MBU2713939.1 hypothetical protein [Zooshikella harenae]
MRKIRNTLAVASILPGMLIIYNYQEGVISFDETLFWLSIFLAVLTAVNLIFSVFTGEAFASGAVVSKSENKGLYAATISVNILFLLISLIGVWKYS